MAKKLLLSGVFGFGLAVTLATGADAAPVRVQDAPGGDGRFVSSALHTGVNISVSGGAFYSQDSGAFGLEKSTVPGFPPGSFSSYVTYCFEVGQFLGLPTTYDSQGLAIALTVNVPSSADAAAAATKIQRLWGQRFTTSVDVLDPNFESVSGATTQERAAAFQSAIWDIAVDNADGIDVGNFKLGAGASGSPQGNIRAITSAYLTIANDTSITTLAPLHALYDATAQNLLNPGAGPGGAVDTPAPASLALLGAGLVGLAAMRRRKNA